MTCDAAPPAAMPEREKPLLAPWVSLTPDPTLFYADARGQLVALALNGVDLARLALTIAEAQAQVARCAIAEVYYNTCPESGRNLTFDTHPERP